MTGNLTLEKQIFNMMGWIEQNLNCRFVGPVVVEESVYRNDGVTPVENVI